LINFANVKQSGGSGDLPDKRVVTVSQVVTLPEFIERSQKLESALESGAMAEFCQQKVSSSSNIGICKLFRCKLTITC